jgi:hypothetical protein
MSLIIIVTVIPDFQGAYQQLALIILFFHTRKTMCSLKQVITDNCNLIDVPTLRRSFEKREAKRVALCLEADGRHFEHLL